MAILYKLKENFIFKDDEIILDDIGGAIFEKDGNIYFVYCNVEPFIPADSENLEQIVKEYVEEGNDGFADTIDKYGLKRSY